MFLCCRNSTLFHFHALQKQVKMFRKIFKTWNSLPARWESEIVVSLHSNYTLQARKPQYFHWVSASLPPSILVKYFGLKTTFQSKMLVFICFRFSPNSEQTGTSDIMTPLFAETLKIVIKSSIDISLSAPTASSPPSICPPEAPWLSVWVALLSRQAGGIMCSQSVCKVFVNQIFCYLILLAKPPGLTALNLDLQLQ